MSAQHFCAKNTGVRQRSCFPDVGPPYGAHIAPVLHIIPAIALDMRLRYFQAFAGRPLPCYCTALCVATTARPGRCAAQLSMCIDARREDLVVAPWNLGIAQLRVLQDVAQSVDVYDAQPFWLKANVVLVDKAAYAQSASCAMQSCMRHACQRAANESCLWMTTQASSCTLSWGRDGGYTSHQILAPLLGVISRRARPVCNVRAPALQIVPVLCAPLTFLHADVGAPSHSMQRPQWELRGALV